MATLKKTVNETYYWSINRMCELAARGNFQDVMNGDSIRQEFAEWLLREDKEVHHNIVSLEYMGEGSEYDI